MTEMTATKTITVLLCLVKNNRFCIDLTYIHKILPLSLLEEVPFSPSFVAGLLNIAGKSIPVIDLGLRLGFARNCPYSLDVPILLCAAPNLTHPTGLIVDKIMGLIDLSTEDIETEEFKGAESFFIGSAKCHSELALLINMEHILRYSLLPKNNLLDKAHGL